MKAIKDYSAALLEIQTATLSKKIIWERNQPDSYTYKTVNDDLEDLILTLQRVEINDCFEYKLSLVKKNFESSNILLTLDTSTTDKNLKASIEELFNYVEYHVDLNSLEGLRSFIDSVKNGNDSNSN